MPRMSWVFHVRPMPHEWVWCVGSVERVQQNQMAQLVRMESRIVAGPLSASCPAKQRNPAHARPLPYEIYRSVKVANVPLLNARAEDGSAGVAAFQGAGGLAVAANIHHVCTKPVVGKVSS